MSTTITLPSRVEVTAEHIAAGVARSCWKDPVALAILDALAAAGTKDVSVLAWAADITVFTNRQGTWVADTPESAARFMGAFDNRAPVEPFSFGLTWRLLPRPLGERPAS